MPDRKGFAPPEGERSNLRPCPQCGGKQTTTCDYVTGKGYILRLECADGCGYRRVI